ncbi:hypothetical protein ACFQDN_22060 [Pseudomonas asuensis]|uniref:Uncharacterized protein n=1 Tax=Pseudomonas asuensis TaxID=1825787 RepID=A0ABQ2H2U8_9PSED|nr:hypothetical protein [Pseudomonas asuensis]GGM25684.1 hypothetical protein GCM10009425_40550 [Pseudomonas asuensis]
MTKKAGIHIGPQLDAIIGVTGERAGITTSRRVNVIGDRYAEILRRERIEKHFSEAEWNALRDMLCGVSSEPAAMIRGSLAMGWEDSLEDGLAFKWDVDAVIMNHKLAELTYLQEVCIIEAVERWWRNHDDAGSA